jgi:hypothetical protein
MLGYAMIGHKSQGATLQNNVAVHVQDAFCAGLMYVMLSRVPSRDRLRIVGCLTPDMFKPLSVYGFTST